MSMDNFIFQQQRLLSSFFNEQTKLSSGREVSVPSDNPVQASRILKLTEAEESQRQILENIRFAGDFLNATDAALTDVTDSLIRVEQLASGAVGSLSLPEEREAAAIEIDSIIQQMVSTANRQFLGLYVFGGREVQTQPMIDDLDGLRYVGDTGRLQSLLASDSEEEFNLTADDAFGTLSARIVGSVDLNPAITLETRLDELQGASGLGIRLGSVRFVEDGAAGAYSVDLTQATSVGQIIDLINAAAARAGSSLTATINTAQDGIRIDPGDDLTISTVDNGATASDLGIISNTPTGAAIEGLDLNRLLTPNTLIADLAGGAGLDFTGNSFTIINGSHSVSIDLAPAETVQDILNAINEAQIGVRAGITADGRSLQVINEISGSVMSITEAGGTAASDLGLRTLGVDTALDDLNFGEGVRTVEGQDDLEIVAKDGTAIAVDLDTARTLQDVIDLINEAAATAGAGIEASLSDTANGILISDTTAGADALAINRLNLSQAIEDLGLDEPIDAAATEVTGRDVGGVRVDGVFSALIALRDALLVGDEREITAAAGRIHESLNEVTRTQGALGAQVRAMEARGQHTQDAVESTRILLSQVRDLDFAAAITQFQRTQTALQANLLASSQTLNLSLLDFIG